jgi:hypothetical protein
MKHSLSDYWHAAVDAVRNRRLSAFNESLAYSRIANDAGECRLAGYEYQRVKQENPGIDPENKISLVGHSSTFFGLKGRTAAASAILWIGRSDDGYHYMIDVNSKAQAPNNGADPGWSQALRSEGLAKRIGGAAKERVVNEPWPESRWGAHERGHSAERAYHYRDDQQSELDAIIEAKAASQNNNNNNSSSSSSSSSSRRLHPSSGYDRGAILSR